MSYKVEYLSDTKICMAHPPMRAEMVVPDGNGNLKVIARYGDWSKDCKYCGRPWTEHK